MADEENVSQLLHQLFKDGLSHSQMLHVLRTEHNICIGDRTLRRRLIGLNLRRRSVLFDRNQLRNAVMHEVQTTGGSLGYRSMQVRLRLCYGLSVPRSVVSRELNEVDPAGVEIRSRNSLLRREYANKGPNYLIHIDGYDKLKRYGLCIHGAIDGYSKQVLWLKAGHSNNDPKYVAWFFSQYIREIKGVPRCVRMDRGTENTLIEDIQESFRSCHTDDMAAHSVLYGSSNHNQPIERWWRTGRQLAVQFYMDYFKNLELEGLFEVGNEIDAACLRYCYLHIIDQKLQEIKVEWNTHTRRANNGHRGGVPNVMFHHPQLQGDVDYKTTVADHDVDEVITLCLAPKIRGCNTEEKEVFDNVATNTYGRLMVPCSLQEAKDLYIALRAAL